MRKLVFFLEEASASEMLKKLLPRLLGESLDFQCIHFEGKQDMEKQLKGKLRNWQAPDCYFVVMRDQDNANCLVVKQKLIDICSQAGKPEALVRIICRELESWYLGDLNAVELGLGITGLAQVQNKSKYRNPDALSNAKQELRHLTRNGYQPIDGSRKIGQHLSLENNRSTSFNTFVSGIRRLMGNEQT